MTYNGTKLGQDSRFKNADTQILSSMKIPKIYKTTVSKTNLTILPIIKLWLNKKINNILEFEDETLANLIINLIKSSDEKIDPKNIQYQISGFLGDNAYNFMKQFWKLLINIQELYVKDKNDIPEELIPFKEEYEKRKQFFNSNKRKIEKIEKSQKDYDEPNSNDNYNEEIINIEPKNKEQNKKYKDDYKEYKERDSKDYYIIKEKEKYYKRSRSIDSHRYRSRSRSSSRRTIRNYKEKYRNISRSRSTEKRYDYHRSRSRNRRSRYKSRSGSQTRSRNNRKYEKKNKKYRDDYKYRRSKEKRRKNSEDLDSCYTKSYDSRNYRKKKNENDYRKSLSKSSDSSSETLKIEPEKSLLSDSRSSEDFQNIKSSKINYKFK